MKSLLIHCYGLILVILILQYVPQNTASCQETQVESSPKIGLVLSGGGARGFAHIGVLNILDSLNIPIDYVAGTSIGSIVGGLYAAGYSAHRIDSLVRSIDWPAVFSDLPSRSKLTYLEKQDMGRFQMTLRLNKLSPQPPSGLIYGQNISLLLSRFTLPQWEVTNFDSLPIPFRCVAADLITGREVVLRQGSLAKAIRASMSVPSIFSPVEWGDSLLVDGGVLNNCPVDVVREMGADYIIAVNVGTPKRSREELQNALSVLVQSFSLAGYQREEENLKQADLVLTPDLINYSSADFYKGKVEGMIREGEKVARTHLAQLKSLQRSSTPSVREISSMDLDNSLIYRIEITGNEKLNFSFIYQLLGLRPGQPMNISLLERRIEHLYSLGYFQTITYQVRQHGPNRYILRLSVKEKIQRVLRLGMRYQDDKKLIAGVNLKLNDFPFAGMRNEFTFLFSGIQLFEWETSLPRRMFGSRIYPYIYSYYQDVPIVIYSEREKIAGYHKRSFGTAPGIGLILKNWGVVKAEYNIEKLLVTPSIAFAEGITWPEWKYLVHTARIYSVADFLDDPLDPRHGYKGQFDYEKTLDMLDQQDSFDKLYLKQSFYGQIFPKTTTGMHLFLGLGRNLPVYRYFYLGGPDSFVGMNYDEFFGPNVAIYGIDNKIRLNNRFSLLAIFNGGNLWDDYQNFDLTKNRYTGYGGGIQINTIAGPFRFIIGHSGGITYQYFTLGFSLSTRMDERY